MNTNEVLGELNQAMSTLNDNIPEPIKQGFFRAIGRLGSAALDIPTAKLEGFAQEIRATNESRLNIIKSVGENIGKNIETPKEYSDFAVRNYSKKILREQVNIDAISRIATSELNQQQEFESFNSDRQITDDWINEFDNISRTKSSDDMRGIFGKILAQEVCTPGRFSIKTLRIVSQLDRNIAEQFVRLCSLCISTVVDGVIVSVMAPSYNSGMLQHVDLNDFNFSFNEITDLVDYGLVLPIDDLEMSFSTCIVNSEGIAGEFIRFKENYLALTPKDNCTTSQRISTKGVFLTKAGRDLYNILEFPYDDRVYLKLNEYFNKNGWELI